MSRPKEMALDGDPSTYWATAPGTETGDLMIDFGSQTDIKMLRVKFRYKPYRVALYKGAVPCGECPWTEVTFRDNVLECNDGKYVDIAASGWDGCIDPNDYRGGRAKCPPNYPKMCNEPCFSSGTDGADWCCATSCDAYGGLRT